jgi:hypothetical protein
MPDAREARLDAAVTTATGDLDAEFGELAPAVVALTAAMGDAAPNPEHVGWFVLACTRPPLNLTVAQIVNRADQLAGVWQIAMRFGHEGVHRVLAVRWSGPAGALDPGNVLRSREGRMQILRSVDFAPDPDE